MSHAHGELSHKTMSSFGVFALTSKLLFCRRPREARGQAFANWNMGFESCYGAARAKSILSLTPCSDISASNTHRQRELCYVATTIAIDRRPYDFDARKISS